MALPALLAYNDISQMTQIDPEQLTATVIAQIIHASETGNDPPWTELDKSTKDKKLETARAVLAGLGALRADVYILHACLQNFIYGVEHGDDVFTAMRDWVQPDDLVALAVALDLERGKNNPEYKMDLERDNPLYYVVPYIKEMAEDDDDDLEDEIEVEVQVTSPTPTKELEDNDLLST